MQCFMYFSFSGSILPQLSHEKHVQRARAVVSLEQGTALPSTGPAGASQAAASKEVQALYHNVNGLGLKAGETIR